MTFPKLKLPDMDIQDRFAFLGLAHIGAGVFMLFGAGWSVLVVGVLLFVMGHLSLFTGTRKT